MYVEKMPEHKDDYTWVETTSKVTSELVGCLIFMTG